MRDPIAEAEIERIERVFADQNFKIEEVIKYIDPDEFVSFDFMPPTITSKKMHEEHLKRLVATLPKFTNKILRMKVYAGEDFGFANSIQHLELYDEKGNVTLAANIRVTVCYRKSGGKWLQVAQHGSVPMDLNSGQPILDTTW